MTEIRTIHGIPGSGLLGRGRQAKTQAAYIPYLSMTAGEMRLAILQEQSKILAAAYPDQPEFKQAETMLSNALHAGVSTGFHISGSIQNGYLKAIAREVQKAVRQQKPASKIGIIGRSSLAKGIHIGEVIPVTDRLQKCLKDAGANPAKVMNCYSAAKIEEILNNGIEKSGHHVLYKNLKTSDNLPTDVRTKRLFHLSGIEGLAVAGDLDKSLMNDWVELAILRANTAGGVGAIGSREASLILGKRVGIGEPISVTVLAIATLIGAALGGAASLLKELRSKKAYAMSEARGFGTSAFSGNPEDWDESKLPDESNNDNLLLLGAGLAAYLIFSE
ncbi:MAG: hypothetical protein R3A50_04780 [Saprospiraceae bacterium]